jgi:hypothetical protein
MKTILMADPVRFPRMTTEETRETFLLNQLYEPGKINFNYVPEIDRAAVGMVAPVDSPIALPTYPQLRAEYFTERRELGALNIGGAGVIRVGGKSYELNNSDVLYIGRGNAEVSFASKDKAESSGLLSAELPGACHLSGCAGAQGRRDAEGNGQRGGLQSSDDLQVHISGRSQKLPTGDGRDDAGSRAVHGTPCRRTPTTGGRKSICTSICRTMRASFI